MSKRAALFILAVCALQSVPALGQPSGSAPASEAAAEAAAAPPAEVDLSSCAAASDSDFTVAAETAPISEADVQEIEEDEDNIYVSSALLHSPEPVNMGGNGSLTITRYDTGEKLTARYRHKDGTYDPEALKSLDRIMRCSLTGREIPIAVKLLELLDRVEDKFGKHGLILLSGYRTYRNNHNTPGAARESLHMLGWAADIRVPGYSSAKVRKFACGLRAGGVGWYPHKGFTHLDVGKDRHWVMRPRRKRRSRSGKRTSVSRPQRAPVRKPARPGLRSRPSSAAAADDRAAGRSRHKRKS